MYLLSKELPSGRIKEILRGSMQQCSDWLMDRGLVGDARYCIDELPLPPENSGKGSKQTI